MSWKEVIVSWKEVQEAKLWLMSNGYAVAHTVRQKWLLLDRANVETVLKSDAELIQFAKSKGWKEGE